MLALRRQSGFTLVETLASLLVFSIVTLGIVPLIITAMAGANTSRSFTVGKNAALEAVERIRGLPYHVRYTDQPTTTKVDVLDLFFPEDLATEAGQTYADGLFTTVCDSSSTNPACLADKLPDDLPDFLLTVRACFVDIGAGANACIDDAASRDVPTSYAWDTAGGTKSDAPPSQLMEVSVTTTWTMGGRARSFDIRTLIGDKDFGALQFRGEASVANAVDVRTNFDNGTLSTSLQALFGTVESIVQATGIRSAATQSISAGELRLLDTTDPTNAFEPTGAPAQEGANATLQAPPDEPPFTLTSAPAISIAHPTGYPLAGEDVASLNASDLDPLSEVTLGGGLPAASGGFTIAGPLHGWLTPARDQADILQLDPVDPLFFLGSLDLTATVAAVEASTSAESFEDASGGIETAAEVSVPRIRLFPTTFISDESGENAVVLIDDFSASVGCDADADGTSVADADWSATLSFWRDAQEGDEVTTGSYVPLTLGSAVGSDPLAAFTPQGNNPLVYEFPDPLLDPLGHPGDVYLFPVTHNHVDDDGDDGGEDEEPDDDVIVHEHPGYLSASRGWSSSPIPDVQVTGDDRIAGAAISQAIRLRTVPVDSSTADSFISVSVGSLSCSAEDQR